MSERVDVGLLGATGTVGREIARLLKDHPWFRLTEVAASAGSAGHPLGELIRGDSEDPHTLFGPRILDLVLKEPGDRWKAPILLSALPSGVASSLEPDLARRGHLVVSNASSHRMAPDVPLVIPEINPGHLELTGRQSWPGALVTNPNCSVCGLALALAPLHEAFGIEAVTVTTMQAISGAGKPGPSAGDMLDNVLPHIPGEEDKLASEPQRILGILGENGIDPAPFPVSPQAHRVSVLHGHLEAVSVKLSSPSDPAAVARVMAGYRGHLDQELPTSPATLIQVLEDPDRPQPKLDRGRGGGMTVSVGRIRECPVLDVRFNVLVHNLMRGAAGAALLNAELCHARGLVERLGAP